MTEKEQRCQYKKNVKKTKRELKQLAKSWGPWDYGFIEHSILIQLRAMYDYYSLGYNVWGIDTLTPNRLEVVKHLLELWDTYEYVGENYPHCTSDKTEEQLSHEWQEHSKQLQAAYQAFWLYLAEHMHELWD